MKELPQIHLINLDRSADRLRQFRERNPHITDFVRVSAVDGSQVDRQALIQAGRITADLPYGAGALGCALSHIGLWEKAVAEDRSITVFEDDIAVSRHFVERAGIILSQIAPDWDFILWGYLLNPLYAWVDLGATKTRLHGYGPNRYSSAAGAGEFQGSDFPSTPIRLLHCFGLQAYSISKKGAQTALDYYLPMKKRWITFPDAGVTTEDEGVDCALCGLYPSTAAYICMPQLAIACDDIVSVRKQMDAA
ncbi:MAG: glycosyltransferase family 25 protein [Hyphomicrobiales bacterium]|nr:glycosyltransferase family 25 protein [Hyphomicrobiales bacterium]MBV8663814.1 glycosyltransferase family 25 protein [Hyphomicrobiales bacterium]